MVIINWLEGRTTEQKRKISDVITNTIVNEGGTKPESVTIIFNDLSRTDVAKAGKLYSDQ